jgi:hypothetical protein
MKRLALAVLLASLGLALAGCAGSGRKHTASSTGATESMLPPTQSKAHAPLLAAIGRDALTGVNLRHGASLLSPTRLAIVTVGSGSCPAVPNRLVVENPDTIRIHLTLGTYRRTGSSRLMRLVTHATRHTVCTADLTTTPMVIVINPKQINVHHRLTVYLYYYKTKKPLVRHAPPL